MTKRISKTIASRIREEIEESKHPNLPINESLWHIEDVAKELNCEIRLLNELVAFRIIPSHRVLKRTLFLKSEIIRWRRFYMSSGESLKEKYSYFKF